MPRGPAALRSRVPISDPPHTRWCCGCPVDRDSGDSARHPSATSFVVATSNQHKFAEIKAILFNFPIQLKSLNDFPPFELPEEKGETYEENAIAKAVAVAEKLKLPALGDDSGLEIESLPGELGLRSNRFLGEQTSYDLKNARILELLGGLPNAKRKAKFVCAAAVAFPNGKLENEDTSLCSPRRKRDVSSFSSLVVRGEVHGEIARVASGKQGFGYDPIFSLPEYGKTMAELSSEEKNKISHRAKAFLALFRALNAG